MLTNTETGVRWLAGARPYKSQAPLVEVIPANGGVLSRSVSITSVLTLASHFSYTLKNVDKVMESVYLSYFRTIVWRQKATRGSV